MILISQRSKEEYSICYGGFAKNFNLKGAIHVLASGLFVHIPIPS